MSTYLCLSKEVDDQMTLRKEIEMLEALFGSATEGMIVCDMNGVIRMMNPHAEKMFGYEPGELLGEKIEALIPMRMKERHVKNRENYSHKPERREMGRGRDLFGTHKKGHEIPVEVSLSPFSTSEGKFIMSFVVDITERKLQERELREANENLKKASEALSLLNAELEGKVQARTEELEKSRREVLHALERERHLNELKSRFVTTASHEFRTPLGTILSSVSLIARYNSQEETEKRLKHVERIKTAVTNLTEILNDFLSLDKLEEGVIRNRPEKFQISALMYEIVEEMNSIKRVGQTIIHHHRGTEDVVLDRQILKNIALNLISNAVKYSPEYQPITVQTTCEKGELEIQVIDRGIGIPTADQEHLFTRFFRAGNAGNVQGTGLGLNIVRKYVELMKGKISVVSKIGEGSVFTVTAPSHANISKS